MNRRDEDREITRLLGELRRSDEAAAPDFRSVLARARVSRVTRRSAWRLAAIAVTLVVVAGALLLARRPDSEADLQAAAQTIVGWKAPTDSLLRTPGSELLRSTPRLATDIPDYSALEAGAFGRATTPKGSS